MVEDISQDLSSSHFENEPELKELMQEYGKVKEEANQLLGIFLETPEGEFIQEGEHGGMDALPEAKANALSELSQKALTTHDVFRQLYRLATIDEPTKRQIGLRKAEEINARVALDNLVVTLADTRRALGIHE